MTPREWVVLSPYRPPGRYPLSPGRDVADRWLTALAVAWHPAHVRGVQSRPTVVDPADHPEPVAGTGYLVPDEPAVVSEFWIDQAVAAGCPVVRVTADRDAAFAGLPADADAARFAGLGLAFCALESLCEAMEHEFVCDVDQFWLDVQEAARNDGEVRTARLKAAAERLHATRDVLYPVEIHWLDFVPLSPGRRPAPLDGRRPINLLVTGRSLNELAEASPDDLARLRWLVGDGAVEIVIGPDEPGDRLAPWNRRIDALAHAVEQVRRHLQADAAIGWNAAAGPELPQWASLLGLTGWVTFGDPRSDAAATRWSSPDGRTLNVLSRAPLAADDPEAIFHLAHHLHHTIMTDGTALIAWRHAGPADPAFEALASVTELAPVFGRWNRAGAFLEEVGHQLFAEPRCADDFPDDSLDRRAYSGSGGAVSGYARAVRAERAIDADETFRALAGVLGESDTAASPDGAALLARRLTARTTDGGPGLLVLNPCAFTRRVPVEDPRTGRVVVELPPLGYAWVPLTREESTAASTARAEPNRVANEYFVAEIDPATGGLRGLFDPRDRVNRIGQQLVWQPGSTMTATAVDVTADEPHLAEVTSSGELLDAHGESLAGFRQRFRAWRGRPLLELRIELRPRKPVKGSPWHAYFGSRFAWRDDRAVLRRGSGGRAEVTTHARPVSPDFIEVIAGPRRVVLLPGGLPFHQRHGARMLDTILMPTGEEETAYELALGLDRPQPMQTALGYVTPVALVECDAGPPRAGRTGWLAHLDATNLALLRLRWESGAATARLLELAGHSGSAELTWARPPIAAELIDLRGEELFEAAVSDNRVSFDYSAHDFLQLRSRWA